MSSMYKDNMSFMRTHKKHVNKVKFMRTHKCMTMTYKSYTYVISDIIIGKSYICVIIYFFYKTTT